MDRRNSTYSQTSARNSGDRGYSGVDTDYRHGSDVRDYDSYARYGSRQGYRSTGADTRDTGGGYGDYADYEGHAGYDDHADSDDDYDEIYEYEDPIDRRWIWVAGVAGAILLIAVICTVVILGGGDSGSVSKTVIAATPTAPPVATSTAPPARSTAPPTAVAPLSPETVTTVAPSPSPTAIATPPVAAPVLPAPVAAPGAITYQVTGTRSLLDLVTVVYTDAQGALQTDFNVALPWVKSVTLNPGVELKSVTATSLTGQLSCSITDSAGAVIVAQPSSSMLTTCTK